MQYDVIYSDQTFDVYYKDADGVMYHTDFSLPNNDVSFGIKIYCTQHPTHEIVGFYLKSNNKLNTDERRRNDFTRYCAHYGFAPDDYLSLIKANGMSYEFIGFLPNGKKYKTLLRNTCTGKYIKATTAFVRRNML